MKKHLLLSDLQTATFSAIYSGKDFLFYLRPIISPEIISLPEFRNFVVQFNFHI